MKRAKRHLDVKFFWQLMEETPVSDAADPESSTAEVQHWSLQVAETFTNDQAKLEAKRPDLHRLPAQTLGIARIRPSGGLCVLGRLTAVGRAARFASVEFELTREVPDTARAAEFDGEPMVQSFLVAGLGRVWITTAEAVAVPGFGREWVAAQLVALRAEVGAREFRRALQRGVRLSVAAPALALAA